MLSDVLAYHAYVENVDFEQNNATASAILDGSEHPSADS